MSTPCELLIYADTKLLADTSARAVLNEAKRLEKKYNYYNQDSFLSALNSRRENLLDRETKTILSSAKRYYKLTNGIFDITIATIKELYKTAQSKEELEQEKQRLLAFVGCEHFSIKKDKLSFDNEYTKIDLGGFVKEYAVDRAVKVLQRSKISSALVNFGGDIYALGLKPNGEKFSIGIKDPNKPTQHALSVELLDQALTTSASYERNYRVEESTFSHIISTQESHSSAKSVTVVSKSCLESGIYSTALMLDETLETSNRVIIL